MQTDEFLFIPKWLSADLFIKLLRRRGEREREGRGGSWGGVAHRSQPGVGRC